MKRNSIALAIACMAVAGASAQSSVTISGFVDAGVILEDGATASVRKVASGIAGPTRLIFRGVEDLGGGTQAFFHLEHGFLVDNGDSLQPAFFGRQAFVGLGGGWGSVRLGLQYASVFTTLRDVGDPFRMSYAGNAGNIFTVAVPGGPRSVAFPNTSAANGLAQGAISRANTVMYFTPNLSGFTAELAYSPGEVAGNSGALRTIGAGAGYASGPFNVRAAYSKTNNAAGSASEKNWVAVGNYDFSVAKVFVAFAKNDNFAGATSADSLLGVSVPLGQGELMASYARKNDKSATNSDPRQIALGYVYRLSKRTQLHASVGHIKNTVPSTSAAFYTVTTPAGPSIGNRAIAIGVAHSF